MKPAITSRAEQILWNVVGGFVYAALVSGGVAVIFGLVLQAFVANPAVVSAATAVVALLVFGGLRTLAARRQRITMRDLAPRAPITPTLRTVDRMSVMKRMLADARAIEAQQRRTTPGLVDEISVAETLNGPLVFRRSRPATRERWLEWLHVEVENVGNDIQPGAWVESWITGQTGKVRMAWTGAREDVDLKPGLPIQIPLVARANEDHPDAPIYGIVLPANRAFITDLTHLKDRFHKPERELLPGGEYRFSLIVHYGNNQTAEACFVVSVSKPPDEAMGLYHTDCADS